MSKELEGSLNSALGSGLHVNKIVFAKNQIYGKRIDALP